MAASEGNHRAVVFAALAALTLAAAVAGLTALLLPPGPRGALAPRGFDAGAEEPDGVIVGAPLAVDGARDGDSLPSPGAPRAGSAAGVSSTAAAGGAARPDAAGDVSTTAAAAPVSPTASRILEPGAQVRKIAGGFGFTEGPVEDAQGDLFFTDIRASRILRRSAADGAVATFLEGSGGANGLALGRDGRLIACEGDRGRVTAIDRDGRATVLADGYGGKRFNKPNDLWIDPRGGIYFTDPAYGGVPVVQGGEHVYYISPDGSPVVRVIDDLKRPNGITGSPDGKSLYVTDEAGGQTYAYVIGEGGALTGKRICARHGGDGIKLDVEGNLYIAARDGVRVYDPRGRPVGLIKLPEVPANLCFTGEDMRTLVITARTSVYAVRVKLAGARARRRGRKVRRFRLG